MKNEIFIIEPWLCFLLPSPSNPSEETNCTMEVGRGRVLCFPLFFFLFVPANYLTFHEGICSSASYVIGFFSNHSEYDKRNQISTPSSATEMHENPLYSKHFSCLYAKCFNFWNYKFPNINIFCYSAWHLTYSDTLVLSNFQRQLLSPHLAHLCLTSFLSHALFPSPWQR